MFTSVPENLGQRNSVIGLCDLNPCVLNTWRKEASPNHYLTNCIIKQPKITGNARIALAHQTKDPEEVYLSTIYESTSPTYQVMARAHL